MNNNKLKKLLEIDILRAFSALAVITVHVITKTTEIANMKLLQFSLSYIKLLSFFAVPSFIFISGLVLFKNYKDLNFSIINFYFKRFSKILPIYLFFSIGYFFYPLLINIVNKEEINFNIFDLVIKLLTGGSFYHLWYFGILFQFYIFFPVLLKLYKRYKIHFLISSFFIQIFWNYFLIVVNTYTNLSKLFFPGYIFYFIFGLFFVENKEKIIKIFNPYIGLFFILFLNFFRTLVLYSIIQNSPSKLFHYFFFIITITFEPFFFIMVIIFIYLLSLLLITKTNVFTKFLKEVGKNSLEIYLIHALIIILIIKIIYHFNITPVQIFYYPVLWITTVSMSYIFALIYRKIINYLKYVIKI